MKTITFQTDSETKIHRLIKAAKEMGIEAYTLEQLTDEEMALPGQPPTKEKLENWLAKENGEKYTVDKAFNKVKTELAKSRRKKK